MTRRESELRDLFGHQPPDPSAEQRLQDWLADLPRSAARRRVRRGSLAVIGAAVAIVAVVLTAAVVLPRNQPVASQPSTRSGSINGSISGSTTFAGSTFVTVKHTGSGTPPYGADTVQIRDLRDGRLLADVYRVTGATNVSAAVERDGDVLVAVARGCKTTLVRVDPRTGTTTQVASIGEVVSDIALSPNGARLAYLTYPKCSYPYVGGDLEGFLPNVLVVFTVATGASVRTATPDQGYPFFGVSWSPDSRRIVAGYAGGQLLVLDASRPDFSTAARISARAGCVYEQAVWTTRGIVTAEACGGQGGIADSRVVRLNLAGEVTADWSLPRCTYARLSTDPDQQMVVVEGLIGSGNGACSRLWAERFSLLTANGLSTVVQIPGSARDLNLSGIRP
jgi:WD40 repeat protein